MILLIKKVLMLYIFAMLILTDCGAPAEKSEITAYTEQSKSFDEIRNLSYERAEKEIERVINVSDPHITNAFFVMGRPNDSLNFTNQINGELYAVFFKDGEIFHAVDVDLARAKELTRFYFKGEDLSMDKFGFQMLK